MASKQVFLFPKVIILVVSALHKRRYIVQRHKANAIVNRGSRSTHERDSDTGFDHYYLVALYVIDVVGIIFIITVANNNNVRTRIPSNLYSTLEKYFTPLLSLNRSQSFA